MTSPACHLKTLAASEPDLGNLRLTVETYQAPANEGNAHLFLAISDLLHSLSKRANKVVAPDEVALSFGAEERMPIRLLRVLTRRVRGKPSDLQVCVVHPAAGLRPHPRAGP